MSHVASNRFLASTPSQIWQGTLPLLSFAGSDKMWIHPALARRQECIAGGAAIQLGDESQVVKGCSGSIMQQLFGRSLHEALP